MPPATIDVALGQPFALTLRQTWQLPDDALAVTFDNITEDSRCPLDVMCAWRGAVRVQLAVKTPAQNTQTFVIGGSTDPYGVVYPAEAGPAGPTSMWIDGYQIDLQSVTPYPAHASEQIPLSAYVVTLLITKAEKPGGSSTPLPTAIVLPTDPQGMPMLCISEVVLTQLAAGMTQASPAQLTPPVGAAALADEQGADGFCAALFDTSWHMAESSDLTGAWETYLPAGTPYWVWDWVKGAPVAVQ